MSTFSRTVFSFAITLVVAGGFFTQSVAQTTIVQGLVADKAMVVSAREEASRIGIEIIRHIGVTV